MAICAELKLHDLCLTHFVVAELASESQLIVYGCVCDDHLALERLIVTYLQNDIMGFHINVVTELFQEKQK